MKATKLFDGWRGMAPDIPRDAMGRAQTWLMRDWIPRARGSQLEARKDWRYSTHGPLNGPVLAQKYVSTYGSPHYLVTTPSTVYDLDSLEAPHVLESGQPLLGHPMAALFNIVAVPRNADIPIFFHYAVGAAKPTMQWNASVPPARHIESWNDYFVLANTAANPGRVHWYGPIGATGVTSETWDVNMWEDSISDVTGLARTRTSILVFHADGVERFRGSIPPSSTGVGDMWRETLMGMGGCTAPHTITYWNDNVLFCDGRGAYITDGTQIKDLTSQAISRLWQASYTATTRLSAGIIGNFWVVSFLDAAGAPMIAWVYDLVERWWFAMTNIPVASFVTTFDQREHLYGGTWDGKVIDLGRMWEESDATANMVDENGVAVLPQLETAWYRMSKQEAVKRQKNAFVSYELDETDGWLRIYGSRQVQPGASDWVLLRECRMDDQDGLIPAGERYISRRLPIGRESFGAAFRFETGGLLRNLKLYDLSIEGPGPREDSYR